MTEAIFRPLKGQLEVVQLGISYYGDPHNWPWPIYPAHIGGNIRGCKRLASLIESQTPDVLFLFNDFHVLTEYMTVLTDIECGPSIVIYCPIDGGPVYPDELIKFHGIAAFVVCTDFAREMVEGTASRIRANFPEFEFPNVIVIPHGVDTQSFFQMPRSEARQCLIEECGFPHEEDSFIVLNANRNQGRKRIDLTVRAFRLFAEGKPKNVKLCLHMGNEARGWDIPKLAARYDLTDRIILSCGTDDLPSWSNEELNHLYNACDIGVNTSISEGWGLVSLEHGVTGAAQVLPNHSACGEIWKKSGLLVNPIAQITQPGVQLDGWIVDEKDVAASLERLFRDRGLLADMSTRARELALSKMFSWEEISATWMRLFEKVSENAVGGDSEIE